MGAKFIVDRRCPVKTTLTLTGLIEGIKYRSLLRRVSELAAAGEIPSHDPGARLDLILPPNTELPEGLTLQDLQVQTAALAEYRITCRQCAASLTGHVGGCVTYVPYPISEGMEYLLWLTAVRALDGDLPEGLLPRARAFAEGAVKIEKASFADGMRQRGDLLAARPRVRSFGPWYRRRKISSAQVLDAFFANGVLGGDTLRIHLGFLSAALAVARAMEAAMADEERRLALAEDTEPYRKVAELMHIALDQGHGIYVWP